MKIIYISPEIEVIAFLADENILQGSDQETQGIGNTPDGSGQDAGGNVSSTDQPIISIGKNGEFSWDDED